MLMIFPREIYLILNKRSFKLLTKKNSVPLNSVLVNPTVLIRFSFLFAWFKSVYFSKLDSIYSSLEMQPEN